VGAHHTNKNKN